MIQTVLDGREFTSTRDSNSSQLTKRIAISHTIEFFLNEDIF